MGIPVNEQETTITYMRDGSFCKIWTSDTTVMTKLDKLVESAESPDWKHTGTSYINGEIVGKNYETNKKLISFRGKVTTRELTDEQRQAAAERLKASRGR